MRGWVTSVRDDGSLEIHLDTPMDREDVAGEDECASCGLHSSGSSDEKGSCGLKLFHFGSGYDVGDNSEVKPVDCQLILPADIMTKSKIQEQFQKNDRIQVDVSPGLLVRLSFIFYFLPILFFISGAVLATRLGPNSEPANILGGVSGLALGLLFALVWRRFFSYTYTIRHLKVKKI